MVWGAKIKETCGQQKSEIFLTECKNRKIKVVIKKILKIDSGNKSNHGNKQIYYRLRNM